MWMKIKKSPSAPEFGEPRVEHMQERHARSQKALEADVVTKGEAEIVLGAVITDGRKGLRFVNFDAQRKTSLQAKGRIEGRCGARVERLLREEGGHRGFAVRGMQ